MNYVPLYAPAVAGSTHLKGPHVDFAGLSPLIALLGGAAIVLLVGLLGSRWVRSQVVPALTLWELARASLYQRVVLPSEAWDPASRLARPMLSA